MHVAKVAGKRQEKENRRRRTGEWMYCTRIVLPYAKSPSNDIFWRSRRGFVADLMLSVAVPLYTIESVRASDEREWTMEKRKRKVPQTERFGRSGFYLKHTSRGDSAAD